ncbi:uncharacterized protein B4U80_13989, partial [Leptotrombidium deliense]
TPKKEQKKNSVPIPEKTKLVDKKESAKVSNKQKETSSLPKIQNPVLGAGLRKHKNECSKPASKKKQEYHTVMIGYVRTEATNHAVQLCDKLKQLGITDLNEIESGDSWEQSLNDAVVNCKIFVPIVTPKYGLTTWTKKELQAAVLKEDKKILPVNLIDEWAPQHLHLLLSCIQFIPGVVINGEPKFGYEKNWKKIDVERVANVILEKTK